MFDNELMSQIRDRFCHVDTCPYQGPRIFFENAGGGLTLKSVVEVNTQLAGIPDNQGRDNPASHELVRIINEARDNMRCFLGVDDGPVFTGESGTELIFRMVRAAALGSPAGNMVGSTLEHPATVSASKRWAQIAGKEYRSAVHDNELATITADDYAAIVDAERRHQLQCPGRGRQNLRDPVEAGLEMSVDPDHQVSLLQAAHMRWFEGEVMRRLMRVNNQLRNGDVRHDCAGYLLQRRNRRDYPWRRRQQRGLQA